MNEVFTISGASLLPMPQRTVSAVDVACAQKVKIAFATGVGMTVGTVPVGIYGVYKLVTKNPGAGIAALLSAAALGFFGQLFVAGAARGFEVCRRNG